MRRVATFIARSLRAAALVSAACLVAGCASNNAPRPAEDPRTAEPAYWLAQPPTTAVVSDDFQSLWRACRSAAVGHSFTVDRVDFRSGLMTTLPLVSKQFFEFWRNDVVTPRDLAESSLHSVRRTVRFEVRRLDDGRYEAVPKVLLERYSFAERRVTSVARFAEVFTTEQVEGSRARDRLGGDLPETYWYAAGRDRALEKALAESIRNDLRA
jgi:hypothetical protein